MRKFIVVMFIAVVAMAIGLQINYEKNHFTGYLYENTHVKYDDGFARGENWSHTGAKFVYSIDQLQELAKSHKASLTGLFGGPYGVAIELTDELMLFIPGAGPDSGIAETYGLF